jgi:tRNA threonylcarbamoyl adenosine modification protein (Sua5/YciO/YrdC/YwlC family)
LSFDDPQVIETAVSILDEGGCIVVPTDTVYGLAVPASDPTAIALLQQIKGRTDTFPPPVLVADMEQVWALVDPVSESIRALGERFWPGPLTLILPTKSTLSLAETTGTLGLRVPDHDGLRGLLRHTGPLAVSSANKHTCDPATTVEEAISQLGTKVNLYIDAGPTPGPAPSTVVDVTDGIRVLRVGLISEEKIAETGGIDV